MTTRPEHEEIHRQTLERKSDRLHRLQAPVTLAHRADETGEPPPTEFYELRDNLARNAGAVSVSQTIGAGQFPTSGGSVGLAQR